MYWSVSRFVAASMFVLAGCGGATTAGAEPERVVLARRCGSAAVRDAAGEASGRSRAD
jgi:hypothetical protein